MSYWYILLPTANGKKSSVCQKNILLKITHKVHKTPFGRKKFVCLLLSLSLGMITCEQFELKQ